MCLGIMTVPIINKVILGWVAFGAGFAVAGGFIAFISLIGIVTRLAGLTKTADAIPTYENSMALGLIFFNLVSLYQPDLQWISYTAALSIINIVGLFYRNICWMSCRCTCGGSKYYSYIFQKNQTEKRISLHGKSRRSRKVHRLFNTILCILIC